MATLCDDAPESMLIMDDIFAATAPFIQLVALW